MLKGLKLKTIIVTSSFPLQKDDYKGNFVYNYAKMLNKVVYVVAPHNKNSKIFEKWDNIIIIRIPYSLPYFEKLFYNNGVLENIKNNPFVAVFGINFLINAFIFLSFFVKKGDKIITNWIFPTGIIGSLIKLLKKDIKHEIIVHSACINLLNKFKLKKTSKFIEKYSDYIQFVNSVHLKWFEQLIDKQINHKIKLEPMPVSLNIEDDFKKEYNFKNILFIGRIVEIKGLDLMLENLKDLDVNLVIAGDGYLKNELEQKYPFAKFTGFVKSPQKEELFKQSSIVIVPSIKTNIQIEGFPTVILEAIKTKNIVLISNQIEGIDYYFKNNENVIFYNPYTTELKEIIKKFIKKA